MAGANRFSGLVPRCIGRRREARRIRVFRHSGHATARRRHGRQSVCRGPRDHVVHRRWQQGDPVRCGLHGGATTATRRVALSGVGLDEGQAIAVLEFDDIQHILLTRTPAITGRYEFLSFDTAAGGRAWLTELLNKVQSAADVQATMDSADRWVTLAFTWNGLRALGV